MRPRVEVAAAVLQRPDGRFLLAQRPPSKVYAGYWEFPGGKIESGEAPAAALARELHEELAIDVKQAYPWITRDYDYEHAAVRLRFYRVTDWIGELHGRENQAFAWQDVANITVAPLLPANAPILRALALPSMYGISNAWHIGPDPFLRRMEIALDAGLRLVQIREKALEESDLVTFTNRAVALARARGAKVLVNAAPATARCTAADGVHLSSARLLETSVRPDFELVGASCHDERELARAARVGVDFVVLGPVRATTTHPGARTLGWRKFAELVAGYALPVYAVGGLGHADFERAWSAGAHGVAAIRAAWPP
jgi:8-oxo-dGTP diphosphatase